MHRERVKVDRLVKVRNDLQHEMRRDSQMALPCVTKLNLREEELEQSRLELQSVNANLDTQRTVYTKLQSANHELNTRNIRLRNSIHSRGLERVDSQEPLALQPEGETVH